MAIPKGMDKVAITVLRSRAELEELWRASPHRVESGAVSFRDAPGDRGTEIHAECGDEPRAEVLDALRRFKQVVETGEITRSDATPDGEKAEAKLDQRPAQPLEEVSA